MFGIGKSRVKIAAQPWGSKNVERLGVLNLFDLDRKFRGAVNCKRFSEMANDMALRNLETIDTLFDANIAVMDLENDAEVDVVGDIAEKRILPKTLDDIPSATVYLHGFRLALAVAALCLSMFLASLDQTIVATTIPRIASDFNSLGQISWIGTAYLLTSTAFQPLYGKFSDIFGVKKMLLLALIVFLGDSIGCGASSSMTMLIVWRAIAGIGGGGLITIPIIGLVDIVLPETSISIMRQQLEQVEIHEDTL